MLGEISALSDRSWRLILSYGIALRSHLLSFVFSLLMLNEKMSNQTSMEETPPTAGRLTPIGSISSDTEHSHRCIGLPCSADTNQSPSGAHFSANEELRERIALLEEHEKLNASLAALTRHFAHVQLRLQQVVSAPTAEDREVTLHSLRNGKRASLFPEFTSRTA